MLNSEQVYKNRGPMRMEEFFRGVFKGTYEEVFQISPNVVQQVMITLSLSLRIYVNLT